MWIVKQQVPLPPWVDNCTRYSKPNNVQAHGVEIEIGQELFCASRNGSIDLSGFWKPIRPSLTSSQWRWQCAGVGSRVLRERKTTNTLNHLHFVVEQRLAQHAEFLTFSSNGSSAEKEYNAPHIGALSGLMPLSRTLLERDEIYGHSSSPFLALVGSARWCLLCRFSPTFR